jgi:hypothetical protein
MTLRIHFKCPDILKATIHPPKQVREPPIYYGDTIDEGSRSRAESLPRKITPQGGVHHRLGHGHSYAWHKWHNSHSRHNIGRGLGSLSPYGQPESEPTIANPDHRLREECHLTEGRKATTYNPPALQASRGLKGNRTAQHQHAMGRSPTSNGPKPDQTTSPSPGAPLGVASITETHTNRTREECQRNNDLKQNQ